MCFILRDRLSQGTKRVPGTLQSLIKRVILNAESQIQKTMLSRWVLVITGLVSLKMFSVAQDSTLEEAWRDWKTTYGKVYTEEEESSRRTIWEKNRQMVEQHNREADEGKHTYWVKMNEFSDWTDEELDRTMGGLYPESNDPQNASQDFPQMQSVQQRPKPKKYHLQRYYGTLRKDQLTPAHRRDLGKDHSENFGKLCLISSNGTKKQFGRTCRCTSRYRRRCQKCCKLPL